MILLVISNRILSEVHGEVKRVMSLNGRKLSRCIVCDMAREVISVSRNNMSRDGTSRSLLGDAIRRLLLLVKFDLCLAYWEHPSGRNIHELLPTSNVSIEQHTIPPPRAG